MNNKFAVVQINDENPSYSSLVPTNREEAKLFYNAVENPEEKLSSYINKKVTFTNVHMEQCEIMEKDDNGEPTGVVNSTIKTVLITPEGKGIISTSRGIARALISMFGIFGTPDSWEEPMTVIVKQIEIGKNRTFKLEVC